MIDIENKGLSLLKAHVNNLKALLIDKKNIMK